MTDSLTIFKRFALVFIERYHRASRLTHQNLIHEDRRIYAIDEEGNRKVHMYLEEELTHRINQTSNHNFFVVSFTNSLQQKVYRVLQKNFERYYGVSFCVKGDGVIRYRSGRFNTKMEFEPTMRGYEEQTMIKAFEQAIQDLPEFRLHSVTGGLRFEEH